MRAMTIPEWLKATKTTQSELARKLGVSPAMVTMVLSGKRLFHPAVGRRLVEITRGKVTYFELYGKATKKRKAKKAAA